MILTRKINGQKIAFIEPEVRTFAYSEAPTMTSYVRTIDWYFPKAEKNEHPGKYVGRVAKFMRQWNGLTLRAASAKYKISYPYLWRIEHGLWQSISKVHNYLFDAYGLTMKLDFVPIKKKKAKPKDTD